MSPRNASCQILHRMYITPVYIYTAVCIHSLAVACTCSRNKTKQKQYIYIYIPHTHINKTSPVSLHWSAVALP